MSREHAPRRRSPSLWTDPGVQLSDAGIPFARASDSYPVCDAVRPRRGLRAPHPRVRVTIPALSFDGQDPARSMLETIAASVVTVAGLSFSVTVITFTLASLQLAPGLADFAATGSAR